MIHWAFLIPAILFGMALGYSIYQLIELGARIIGTIRKSVRSTRM